VHFTSNKLDVSDINLRVAVIYFRKPNLALLSAYCQFQQFLPTKWLQNRENSIWVFNDTAAFMLLRNLIFCNHVMEIDGIREVRATLAPWNVGH